MCRNKPLTGQPTFHAAWTPCNRPNRKAGARTSARVPPPYPFLVPHSLHMPPSPANSSAYLLNPATSALELLRLRSSHAKAAHPCRELGAPPAFPRRAAAEGGFCLLSHGPAYLFTMYVDIDIDTRIYTYIYIYMYMNMCIYIYMCTYRYISLHICVSIYIYCWHYMMQIVHPGIHIRLQTLS